MLTTLIVSGPKTKGGWRQRAPGLTVSMAAHAAIFYAAAIATMPGETRESQVGARDTSLIYVRSQAQTPLEPPPPVRSESFRSLVPPTHIPTPIPPIDLTRTWDSRDYTGISEELEPDRGVAWPVDPTQVFIDALVDEPPVRISFPPLEYPRALLQVRVEGSVVLEAIIDTLGHPEPGSIRVINSTNRAFEAAARDALRRALFRAGRVQGQRVRVLVRQPLRFQLPRDTPF